MENDGESAANPGSLRGKKGPPSPSTPPSDGEDSATSDEDDDRWSVSDSGTDEEEEDGNEDHGTIRPFTVDDFPRVSSDHYEQTCRLPYIPDLLLRGPHELVLFPAFKDSPVGKGSHGYGEDYQLHDESELRVDNVDCSNSCYRYPMPLVQFIDLKIAGYRHEQPGCAKIFGFFAARDIIKPLRNYIYKREINNYEAVTVKRKRGTAHLSLRSPARGINVTDHVLFEFKLCKRTEDQLEDGPKDEVLIEGCTVLNNRFYTKSVIQTKRLYGEKCGLDLKFAVLLSAVQAKVDIEILHAPACGLNLNLYAKTSGFGDVICLFRGDAKAGSRFSSLVAVTMDSYLDLFVKGSCKEDLCRTSPQDGDDLGESMSRYMWEGRFDACCSERVDKEEVKFDDFTTISVEVTWSMVERRHIPKA